jgi:LPS-assembly protein
MPLLMLRLNPLWLAILSFGALISAARADPQSCPTQTIPSLLPHQGTPSSSSSKPKLRTEKSVATGGAMDILADDCVHDFTSETDVCTGNVVIRQGERTVKADRVQVDAKKNIKGQGGVDYTDPIVHILGAGGDYSPTGGADFKQGQFELLQRPARGTAETMTLTPEGILNLQSVSFTTCPANEKSWSLDAKDITLDTHTKIGEAHDAKIEFQGVPILYLPWVSFPLSDERKSGFLFPVIGETSQSGFIVGAPYYWNIAPNMDFTAEPVEYSRRGIDLGGDFRYLEPGSHGELSWNYLPYDMVFGGSRSDVRLRDTTDLTDHLRFAVDAENVSDTQYFENFSQGPEGASTAFVGRTATLSYRDEHWRIDAQAQEFETIDDTLIELNRPYARAPAITANTDYSWGPGGLLHYGFDSEVVNFQRDLSNINCAENAILTAPSVEISPCVNGWRAEITPTVSVNLDGPGYFLRPKVAYSATQYELSNTLPGGDRLPSRIPTTAEILFPNGPPAEDNSPSRTLPLADVDAGLQFERDLGAAADRKVTLEPRMMYLYVPYRNQDELPVFDTALPDLIPIELFRTNRYVGTDRISDADQVAMGVTSRLLDGHDGRQFLAVTLGQIYYFKTPRVTLPYEVPQSGPWSNFVGQIQINAFKDWSSNVGLQWDTRTSQVIRTDVNIQFKPSPDKVINLAYRFQRGSIQPANLCNVIDTTGTTNAQLTSALYSEAGICGFEQVEISGAWPIGGHWNAFAREVYSLQDKQPIESFAGFEYGACCWRVRFGLRRYISMRPETLSSTSAGPQDTAAWLQLELTGLAGVGSASDAFLIDEIRGYAPSEASSQKLFNGP